MIGKTPCVPNATAEVMKYYPGMEVSCMAEGTPISDDYRTDRLRIFYDPATGLVSKPPRVG